jgi:uncharacterized protein YndB with AHSA1/START domain
MFSTIVFIIVIAHLIIGLGWVMYKLMPTKKEDEITNNENILTTTSTMNHDLSVSQSVIVNASVAKVWQALTTPNIIKDYLYGTETITTWEVGTEIIFQGEYESFKYKDHGTILNYVPNETLTYSYWSGFSGLADVPENYGKVIYNVQPNADGTTTFTWTQIGYPNEEKQAYSKDGMTVFLESVKAVMER